MQRYYRRHSDEYKVDDEYHVLEILLEDRERAEEIRAQLNFGDVRTFKSMARSYSQGLTAQAGGVLGTFRSGQLPENFEKVIFQLKAGEISTVFRSPEGYHIFMIEEWVPATPRNFTRSKRQFSKSSWVRKRVLLWMSMSINYFRVHL